MTARTHDAIGFTALLSVAIIYPSDKLTVLTIFIAVVANVVGSLLPDIDQATNRLWDMLPSGNEMGRSLRKLFLHHRTLTHSALGVFLAMQILGWFLPKILNPQYVDIGIVYWSLMIGYVAHLAADLLTKDGIPLLFPIQWRIGIPPLRVLRVTTGSWVENFLILALVGIYFVWFSWQNQIRILEIIRRISL